MRFTSILFCWWHGSLGFEAGLEKNAAKSHSLLFLDQVRSEPTLLTVSARNNVCAVDVVVCREGVS